MDKKTLQKISNWIFGLTTAFALFTLVMVAYDYFHMNQGVCPIDKNNTLIYIALALLLISVIVTSALDSKVKKMKEDVPPTDIYDQTMKNLKEEDGLDDEKEVLSTAEGETAELSEDLAKSSPDKEVFSKEEQKDNFSD